MELYEDVAARLEGFGCTVAESERTAIEYAVALAAERIKANINRTEIPDELYYTHVDMAAGLFLQSKKDSNTLGDLGEAFDFSAPATKITEGDVSVEFAGASDGSTTPEARFDSLVQRLTEPPQSLFAAFRRIKW